MSLLFSPFQLGGLELANRLVVSPMCQYTAVDGVAQPWHLVHLGTLGTSGAGLVIVEATAVEAIGRITPGCLGLYTDEQERVLADILRKLRDVAPATFGIQLGHAGRKASCPLAWEPQVQMPASAGGWEIVGPSARAFGPGWQVPEELDQAGLARVRDAFMQAATRADRAGFDLIEIHAAHGYLLSAFLSPIANHRADRYGGALEGRMAYPLEVMRAVRAAWPTHKALGIRINATELDERGFNLDEAVIFVRELRKIGIDYVTMSAGNAVPDRTYPPLVPGYQVGFSERVRRETGAATMAVGMILSAQQAEDILVAGRADLIAVGRGFLDNPRWGWHAANALNAGNVYPSQHLRVRPDRWPGYALVHAG